MKRAILLMAFLFSGGIAAANTVGSGGDALRDLFEKARSAAVYNVSRLQWCSFATGTRPEVSKWILENAQRLADDIRKSEQRWVVDTQPTCAFTNHSAQSPVYLSYPTCAATVGTNLNAALFTLLHESSHHLGVSDERQADEVATAIMTADLAKRCPQGTDIFDPQICQGTEFSADDARRYLPPGEKSAKFGTYSLAGRFRNCTHVSGCSAWQSGDAESLYAVANNSVYGRIVEAPFFYIGTSGVAPYFTLSLWQPIPKQSSGLTLFSREGGKEAFSSYVGIKLGGIYPNGGRFDNMIIVKSNCSWYRSGARTAESSGAWTEAEVVLYGKH